MADIYATHFEYDGVLSRKYNLVIVNVDTERLTVLSGTIQSNGIFNKSSKRRFLIGDDYRDAPLLFSVDIITDHERGIEFNQRREIEKWLFNRSKYHRLYFDIVDDPYGEAFESFHGEQKRVYMNCRFINAEKLEYNGGIVGYKAMVETDSPFLWQDEITKVYNPTAESKAFNVKTDFDMDDYIYPTVKITTGNLGGDISIINITDSSVRTTKFVNMPAEETFLMKGEINYISGGFYEKFSDRNFIRLLDGRNEIHVLGDISSISFTWSNRRRL